MISFDEWKMCQPGYFLSLESTILYYEGFQRVAEILDSRNCSYVLLQKESNGCGCVIKLALKTEAFLHFRSEENPYLWLYLDNSARIIEGGSLVKLDAAILKFQASCDDKL